MLVRISRTQSAPAFLPGLLLGVARTKNLLQSASICACGEIRASVNSLASKFAASYLYANHALLSIFTLNTYVHLHVLRVKSDLYASHVWSAQRGSVFAAFGLYESSKCMVCSEG